MKRKLNEIIYTISRYTEIVLSAIMLLVIITLIVPMLYNFLRIPLLDITPGQFTEFLGNALTLLIGVEFVKMLAKHTAEKSSGSADVCHCKADGCGTPQHGRNAHWSGSHWYYLCNP